ncbi:MAG: DUF1080 domain-containing protein [Gemmatimonas sp.]
MTRTLAAILLLATTLAACGRNHPQGGDQAAIEAVLGATQSRNTAAPPRESIPWQSLFDGTTLAGWHGFKTPGKAPAGWQAVDGTLTRVAEAGDLVTDRTYANFELALEWRIAPGGNSGILYRIDPTADVTYESAPEMQVLDDAGHADGASRLTSAGAAYGLYPSPEGALKPVGEWNAARLVVDGAHVEHWLNDQRVVEYVLWSPEWERRVKGSKFAAWPAFGRAQRGYLGLQDHGDRVSYRNIRIRELP